MKIRDGFLALMLKLQFEEPLGLTDTDKLAKIILELNSRVRALNVAYSDQAHLECPEEFKERLDPLHIENLKVALLVKDALS